ncbi:MAG: insulinase family protein [Sarcina sp.]
MNFECGKVYNGFKLLENKEVKEIGAKTLLFEHEKTKAKLIKVVADDDNKVFSIGFRTPPENSTGVAHILEHSVLCGSRKFDMKEPFVELLKGSLNTFLNAMTYPDKTVYPVASRNEKDFFNLIDVYLDAVLYPNIYKHKEIFMQEGWHYNIENSDDDLTYNGVVYNEMKGVYSSADSILYRNIPKSLYPNTQYAVCSGGEPGEIPNLSYEEFLDFHKKYYHPSNAYIFLYGDVDTQKELEFIDREYLSNFEERNIDSKIREEKAFDSMQEMETFYGIAPEDNEDGKSFFSLNFSVGEATDPEIYLAFEVLAYLLLRTTAAPVKKALMDAGVGKSVSGDYDNCINQPCFSIFVKNANVNDKDKFKKIVFDTLENLVKNGIDKELIEASINRVEFELREGDFGSYPKGLIYYLKIMDSWLYEGNPLVHLEYEKPLAKIKTALTTDYFEKLIDKYIIKNPHSSLLSLLPKKGLNEEKAEKLKQKLENIKNNFTNKEIDNLIERCKKLKERQETVDDAKALEAIPVLSRDDINKEPQKLPIIEKEIDGIKILHNNFHTNKISYVNMYFKSNGVKQENISLISFLSDIFGRCDSDNYNYEKLSNLININTGGIGYSACSISDLTKDDEYNTFYEITMKALNNKLIKAFELLEEVIFKTNFDSEVRIKQILDEKKSRIESAIFESGHRIVAKKILAYTSQKGMYEEYLSGLSYYDYLVDILNDFNINKLRNSLEEIRDIIFNKNNLIINFSGTDEDYIVFEKAVKKFAKALKTSDVEYNKYNFDVEAKNEGLLMQGDVQFVAKGGNFKKEGFEYSGAMSVLETILGFDYLWNNVRVKGGAYGVFSNFRRDGGLYIASYRDPNVKETLEVYDGIAKYLETFDISEREMQKYIIGTIRKLDTPITNSAKGELASTLYLNGITYEDRVKEREEVLNINIDKIQNFAPLVRKTLNQECICALGNEKKITENKDAFKTLVKVIK